MEIFNINSSYIESIKDPNLLLALNWIKENNLSKLENGKYIVDEKKDIFAVLSEYIAKDKEDNLFEYHKKYIDVQMLLKGKEYINITDTSNLKEVTKYSKERDIAFGKFENKSDEVLMEEGKIAVFYPSDAHQPCLKHFDNDQNIRKIVLKIKK